MQLSQYSVIIGKITKYYSINKRISHYIVKMTSTASQ